MIIGMSRYWRRRLAERLDLLPSATWYEIEHVLINMRAAAAAAAADAARARRDHHEMQAFLTSAAGYWYAAGAAGEPGPFELPE